METINSTFNANDINNQYAKGVLLLDGPEKKFLKKNDLSFAGFKEDGGFTALLKKSAKVNPGKIITLIDKAKKFEADCSCYPFTKEVAKSGHLFTFPKIDEDELDQAFMKSVKLMINGQLQMPLGDFMLSMKISYDGTHDFDLLVFARTDEEGIEFSQFQRFSMPEKKDRKASPIGPVQHSKITFEDFVSNNKYFAPTPLWRTHSYESNEGNAMMDMDVNRGFKALFAGLVLLDKENTSLKQEMDAGEYRGTPREGNDFSVTRVKLDLSEGV